jgi:hypothetical protein
MVNAILWGLVLVPLAVYVAFQARKISREVKLARGMPNVIVRVEIPPFKHASKQTIREEVMYLQACGYRVEVINNGYAAVACRVTAQE